MTATGSVVDTLNQKPIPGALVLVDWFPQYEGYTEEDIRPRGQGKGWQQVTDGKGHFAISGLSEGYHSFCVTRPGYVSNPGGDQRRRGYADRLRLEPSCQRVAAYPGMGDLPLTLTPGAEISGRVSAETSADQQGVPLTLYKEFYQGGHPAWKPIQSEVTDAHGGYGFRSLHPGVYIVVSGWMIDNDPGPGPGPGCPNETFIPTSGYPPAITPGVPDLASAESIDLRQGERSVADLKLTNRLFHPVSFVIDGELASGFSYFEDQNRVRPELPADAKSHCGRLIPMYADRNTGRRTFNFPRGNYSWRIASAYFKKDPALADPSRTVGGYASFKVENSAITVPITLHPEADLSIPLHVHWEGTQPMPARATRPENFWLTCADPSLVFPCGEAVSQGAGSLEFGDLDPGRYWIQVRNIEPWCVTAISAGGVDLTVNPLVVTGDVPHSAIEMTMSDQCGKLILQYTRPKDYPHQPDMIDPMGILWASAITQKRP